MKTTRTALETMLEDAWTRGFTEGYTDAMKKHMDKVKAAQSSIDALREQVADLTAKLVELSLD